MIAIAPSWATRCTGSEGGGRFRGGSIGSVGCPAARGWSADESTGATDAVDEPLDEPLRAGAAPLEAPASARAVSTSPKAIHDTRLVTTVSRS